MIPQDIANTIVDPKAYAAEKPVDEAFAFLRKEMPLAMAEPVGVTPFWAITKHADILEVEKQNELFHNGDQATVMTTIEMDTKVRQLMGGSPHMVRSLVQMDNPDRLSASDAGLVSAAEFEEARRPHQRHRQSVR